jgi:hypothetical protein
MYGQARKTRRRGGNKERPVLPPIRRPASDYTQPSNMRPDSPAEYSPVEQYSPSPMASPSTGSRQEKFERDLRNAAKGKGRRSRKTRRRFHKRR